MNMKRASGNARRGIDRRVSLGHQQGGRGAVAYVVIGLMIAGCAPPGWNAETIPTHALLRGYGTICSGMVRMAGPDNEPVATFVVPAGNQALIVSADSGPDAAINPVSSDPHYVCSWVTTHHVRFNARPAHVYRFYLDRIESGRYRIQVFEGASLDQVEMTPIESESTQQSTSKRCGFLYGCS